MIQLDLVIVCVLDLRGDTVFDDNWELVAELRNEAEILVETVLLLVVFEDTDTEGVVLSVIVPKSLRDTVAE